MLGVQACTGCKDLLSIANSIQNMRHPAEEDHILAKPTQNQLQQSLKLTFDEMHRDTDFGA